MSQPPSPLSHLQRLWLCETIRLREEHAGPLEDAEANRAARQAAPDLAKQIELRALHLAQRDGQISAQQHWLQGARLARLVLIGFALLAGAGLGFSALGEGSRSVNLFWALGSLLGFNLLMLLGWLLTFSLGADQQALLSRVSLWLSEKLARDAAATQLAPSLLVLLERQRLSRWLIGALTNGLWLLALLSAALIVLLLLLTHRYGFVWETTLLSADTFIALTQSLGALPSLLGFPVPDIDTIRASGDHALTSELARHSWAGWLLGILLVFGILPRALLFALCLLNWRLGIGRLKLDLNEPSYQLLAQRLQPPSESLGVVDVAPSHLHQVSAGHAQNNGSAALVVAIELDGHQAWPPQLPAGISNAGVIDSREQRKHLLDQLSRFPAQRLLIAIDPRRSADRGTLALLGELSRNSAHTRIWLLPAPANEQLDDNRLSDWHSALEHLALPYSDSAPLTWLETGND